MTIPLTKSPTLELLKWIGISIIFGSIFGIILIVLVGCNV